MPASSSVRASAAGALLLVPTLRDGFGFGGGGGGGGAGVALATDQVLHAECPSSASHCRLCSPDGGATEGFVLPDPETNALPDCECDDDEYVCPLEESTDLVAEIVYRNPSHGCRFDPCGDYGNDAFAFFGLEAYTSSTSTTTDEPIMVAAESFGNSDFPEPPQPVPAVQQISMVSQNPPMMCPCPPDPDVDEAAGGTMDVTQWFQDYGVCSDPPPPGACGVQALLVEEAQMGMTTPPPPPPPQSMNGPGVYQCPCPADPAVDEAAATAAGEGMMHVQQYFQGVGGCPDTPPPGKCGVEALVVEEAQMGITITAATATPAPPAVVALPEEFMRFIISCDCPHIEGEEDRVYITEVFDANEGCPDPIPAGVCDPPPPPPPPPPQLQPPPQPVPPEPQPVSPEVEVTEVIHSVPVAEIAEECKCPEPDDAGNAVWYKVEPGTDCPDVVPEGADCPKRKGPPPNAKGNGPKGAPGQTKKNNAAAGTAAVAGTTHVPCSTVQKGLAFALCDKYCNTDSCEVVLSTNIRRRMNLERSEEEGDEGAAVLLREVTAGGGGVRGGMWRRSRTTRRDLKNQSQQCLQLKSRFEGKFGQVLDCGVV